MAGFSTKNLLLLGFLFAVAALLIASEVSAARDLQDQAAAATESIPEERQAAGVTTDGFRENYYGGGGYGGWIRRWIWQWRWIWRWWWIRRTRWIRRRWIWRTRWWRPLAPTLRDHEHPRPRTA
ncbi:hypothetical protein Dimus_014479 [Dionaea muscipula]